MWVECAFQNSIYLVNPKALNSKWYNVKIYMYQYMYISHIGDAEWTCIYMKRSVTVAAGNEARRVGDNPTLRIFRKERVRARRHTHYQCEIKAWRNESRRADFNTDVSIKSALYVRLRILFQFWNNTLYSAYFQCSVRLVP